MDELIQSEERRKAVVKFFANHVAAKYEQGKSTPTNLLGLLGRFSSSENYQWLKRTYPDHRTINFFLDNNDTFEYDDEKDLIKLKENYQGSTEHEDVKNVLSQLTLRVAEESDGPETLPSSPASSISSTSGLDLVRESAEERFLISANMSLEDMRTKYAAKIIEAINLKHEVASYKRRQREFTALKTSHRDLIVKHNALVKNSREIKRRLSAAKSKNFQLELKAGNSDGCEYFAQLVSKLSTDNDFIAILDEEIFDDVLNYFSSIFAQAIGFGDTPSTVNAKVMEYIAVILTNMTYHKEGRERCCQWPNVTGTT
ncbi:hypothetical protein HDE_03094 [Halotydeus destructor]|nr:hypothetical protein HDE_03094 [Halotydeus destructor]